MSHKKFGPNDIFVNRVKMHPEWDFFIYNSEVYINNSQNISGSFSDTYKSVPPGYISLYEYNLDRSGDTIYPFVEKNATFKTRFRKDLNNLTGQKKTGVTPFGSLPLQISSSYAMSASITREFLSTSQLVVDGPFGQGSYIVPYHNHTSSVLKNMCLQYRGINSDFSNTPVSGATQSPLDNLFNRNIGMVNIPSIFYGSEIKKGSLTLNYYVTGTLISTAKDNQENGKLLTTYNLNGLSTGSVVGYVLYREGILFFPHLGAATASLDSSNGIRYDGSPDDAKWIYFAHGANEKDATNQPHSSHISASYSINFEATTYKNTLTMFCHADKAELNYSNNPTFLQNHSGSIAGFSSGKYSYLDNEVEIKNVASSSFYKGEDEFRKVTYISKVGIYDEDNNLLMTVDLARPYKKEEKDNFTFKIKYDLL